MGRDGERGYVSDKEQEACMIIGKLSIDPRRVVGSIVTQEHGRYTLTVKQLIGNAMMETDDYFDSESIARKYQEELDAACYKGELADAVSSKDIDDGDIDEMTITDALIKATEG